MLEIPQRLRLGSVDVEKVVREDRYKKDEYHKKRKCYSPGDPAGATRFCRWHIVDSVKDNIMVQPRCNDGEEKMDTDG